MKSNKKFPLKKIVPLLFVIASGIILWSFRNSGNTTNVGDTKQQMLLSAIGTLLEQKHYNPKPIDDNFSKQVFDKYLSTLDPYKEVFLQSDIASLKKYETTLDDEIHGAGLNFYSSASALFSKQFDEEMKYCRQLLATPFDFTTHEQVQLDGDKRNYPATESERIDTWRKRMKYSTLERYTESLEQKDRNKNTDSAWNKTDAELEKEARSKVLAAFERGYNRQKQMFNDQEQFNMYVNVIVDLMDPHTEYFPPVEKRGFDEEMSGRFYGIGAQLKEEDGAIKVANIFTGSPAFKSSQIQVNDEIIKVAQGTNEAVDVRGYAVTDAVKLIRGNKDTEVKITFKKPDGTLQVVSLIRDEIVVDETFARSAIINENGKKIGYILLPEFYADFTRPDGNRCSIDVGNEILKLKKENVEGIILDLRTNGGGSLYEAVQTVGLFIKDGPVVQLKDRSGNPDVWKDKDPSIWYDGPLAVMVNELSASASEIFAAAIQDYKRGIVIGSSSTYGKGTVQKPIPLGKTTDLSTGQTEFGALKLTFQKFYRINGGSTQLKGVVPDVILPDAYEYIKFREKDVPSALSWDQISKANYTEFNSGINWQNIEQKAQERIRKNDTFSLIKTNTEWIGKNADKEYSLNIDNYHKEQGLIKKKVKQDDSLMHLTPPLNIQSLVADSIKFNNNPDKVKAERYQQWIKNLQSDIYINETMNVVDDIASAQQLVTNVKN